ncbi:Txe/YoeB family addiction module toxin [Chloroflexota bacterium]
MSKGKQGQRAKKRKPVFQREFKEDLKYWIGSNKAIARRALKLVDEIIHRDPFTGTGKPEPLKGFPNTWSRRLTQEHRVVYLVRDDQVDFLQARYHY